MAYVRQQGKKAHWVKPYTDMTACNQNVRDWEAKPIFSKELRIGEEMCSSCANTLRGNIYGDDALPRRANTFHHVKKTPSYQEIKSLIRNKPSQ